MDSCLAEFRQPHKTFIVVAVHQSNPDLNLSSRFFTWLARCILVLCAEIHAASPDLTLTPYPFLLAPSRASSPWRYLIGIQKDPTLKLPGLQLSLLADPDQEGLPTRLECCLQSFVAHCAPHVRAAGVGVWANARLLARCDVAPLCSILTHHRLPIGDDGDGDDDGRVFLTTEPDPTRPQDVALPLSAIAALQATLRMPPADPTNPVPFSLTSPNVPLSRSRDVTSDSAAAAATTAGVKLRPIHDVLARIAHDDGLGGPAAYVIGYADRFDGVKEVRADRWVAESTEEEWVPLHRVRYVRRRRRGEGFGGAGAGAGAGGEADRGVVWSREDRLDVVFGSGVRREGCEG
ncbi:hypothetical protein IWX90DRAFT_205958 [Phyllosticta citrichinensis]|uniref:MJ1316 RNA cyclic group end recognition domain-containing protein n=1 Tax=Phyllosticta citrichinensis TaxID=1130410 RepID=A0ABR1XSX8_9PEZI